MKEKGKVAVLAISCKFMQFWQMCDNGAPDGELLHFQLSAPTNTNTIIDHFSHCTRLAVEAPQQYTSTGYMTWLKR